VVEYVRNVFAISRQGWNKGWTSEEIEYPDVEEEKTKLFIIVRGWDSFRDFEGCLQNGYYTEAVGILYEWKAPFQMVSSILFTYYGTR
jgi:hypothetical protein